MMDRQPTSDLDSSGPWSLVARRRELLLQHSAASLGPTQREHLIDHSQLVADVARQLGRTMDLAPDSLPGLHLAALLHDIGKYFIPELLLAKPARLSSDEWALMARHSEIGAMVSRDLGADAQVASFIRHHHTPYDASLAPLGARIISVADAFATMLRPRSYQPAHGLSESLAELRRQRGRQFDPAVVDAAPAVRLPDLPLAA